MPLAVTTPPAAEPVSLAEAKAQLRITESDDDTLITSLIEAARVAVEQRTRRALITQTLQLTLPDFADVIKLPRPPAASIDTFEYRDTNEATQTVSASIYRLETASTPGRIERLANQTWPTTDTHPAAVTITYTAGYGATSADVPEALRRAVLLLVEEFYDGHDDNRSRGIAALLAPYRVHAPDCFAQL